LRFKLALNNTRLHLEQISITLSDKRSIIPALKAIAPFTLLKYEDRDEVSQPPKLEDATKTMIDQPGQQLILNFPSHPEYNFSNFVVSDGSRIAFEAAKEFCSENPVPYQALYLFGQKNLGKTHLLLSIGNQAAEKGSHAICIQGHDFVERIENDPSFVSKESFEQLLNVDFFLMDNVESLNQSAKAQEKLYHIYNQMMDKGGKLAFTADLSPDKISTMESYLTSRFQWGMVAEIKPIDDSTTAKIILKLAKDIDLALPEPIIHFLLSRIPRDFISIQNAVATINRESYVQKKKVTLPLVKTALELS
jgi:chromosomal replication initiator protein